MYIYDIEMSKKPSHFQTHEVLMHKNNYRLAMLYQKQRLPSTEWGNTVYGQLEKNDGRGHVFFEDTIHTADWGTEKKYENLSQGG